MLSPEAELRALVRDLAEPTEPDQGDHLPLRDVRRLVAKAIRTSAACFGHGPHVNETVYNAVLDLERTSTGTRTGI